jgi:hypothetical protein
LLFLPIKRTEHEKWSRKLETTARKYWIMIIKRKTLFVLSLLASGLFVSCWDNFEERSYYSANVTSFAFSEHDTCPDIEDYVFNIDQFHGVAEDTSTGTIYNLDSLPYGSVVNSLYPDITLQSTNGNIYVGDSLWEEDDSLDFTKPVVLTNTSYDGLYTKRYTIYVNVHQVNPDSMCLTAVQTSLPTAAGANRILSTTDGTLLNYAPASGGGLQLAVSTDTCKSWTPQSVNGLTGTMNLLSLCFFNSTFYVNSTSGQLFSSADGRTWKAETTTVDGVSTSTSLVTLYGELTKKYRDQTDSIAFIGLAKNASGNTCFARSIDGISWTTYSAIPSDFPVSDYGFVKDTTATGVQNYTVAAGLNNSGAFSGSVFATEDGLTWATIDDGSIPRVAVPKRKGAALFKYDAYLVSFGGMDESGKYCKDMHVSPDNGIHWADADDSWVFATMPKGIAYAGAHVVRTYNTKSEKIDEILWITGGTKIDGPTAEVWKAFLFKMVFARR